MARSTSVQALLGADTFEKVKNTKILVVGAGGIGCELLKNLVLVGFANIEIIDLDTIDLSNLNRQFLFRKPDISKSKALVAAVTARHFNPSSGINIHARHGNVKEGTNDVEWIKGFGLVMNALDNADARRHVNKLCQAANTPLIESGTAGYMGQAVPHLKNKTECYECITKSTPKSYPVCTIRATPSEPIHCIVWAKAYLFGKLFGEDDEAGEEGELDKAKAEGENAEEIENLKKEAAAFREVRSNLGEEDGPQRVFQKVFNEDINRLLKMDEMWKVHGRVKPVALDVESINDGSFVIPPLRNPPPAPANGAGPSKPTPPNQSTLKDQQELSVKDNLDLFVDSCKRLSARAIAQPNVVLAFDKDDDDTLDFVVATSNLRAIAYGIPKKTRFEVKGNIIPAIATTNAVVAGLIVMQAIQLLANPDSIPKKAVLGQAPKRPLGGYPPPKPEESCPICRDAYIPLKVDSTKCTLGEFVKEVAGEWLKGGLEDEEEDFEFSVLEGGRILADPDDEDNHPRTLGDMGVDQGKILTIMDEEEKYRPIHFCLCAPEPNASKSYTLPSQPPKIPLRPKKAEIRAPSPDEGFSILDSQAPVPSAEPTGTKRSASDMEDVPVVKKQKVAVDDDDDDDFEIL